MEEGVPDGALYSPPSGGPSGHDSSYDLLVSVDREGGDGSPDEGGGTPQGDRVEVIESVPTCASDGAGAPPVATQVGDTFYRCHPVRRSGAGDAF